MLANESVLLALERELKMLDQEKVTCDDICATSDLLQNIDSSFDINYKFDANNDDVHVFISCYETQNYGSNDIS